jgi:cytochrome o ubiquinol oxidase subunit 2
MPTKIKLLIIILFTLCSVGLFAFLATRGNLAVLSPAGTIASQQRSLLLTAVLLMCIVVVPVLAMTFFIAWKYREGNSSATYSPEFSDNAILETIWWGVPCIIIGVLAVITWNSSHTLDPFKLLNSAVKPITIQVIALQWKWLFIYPEQHIASINFFQFPADTPINFQITSDAPMNSFWIPQLGGQVYAMTGMTTQLHLMADKPGVYKGVSANLSGQGFAGMKFIAKSSSEQEFNQWVSSVSSSSPILSPESYKKLALPSEDNPVSTYTVPDKNLYTNTVMKFMSATAIPDSTTMPAMNMH